MKKQRTRKIRVFREKVKKTVLIWKHLDTNKDASIPYGKEILFLPENAAKSSLVIFSKENGVIRICMDHSLFFQYQGKGIWTELPGRKDIRDGF